MFKKMTAWSALPKNERAKKRFGKRGLKPEQLMAIFRQCSDPKTSAKHIYFMVNGKPTPRRSARIRIKNERVAVHRILYEWFVEKEENFNFSDTTRLINTCGDANCINPYHFRRGEEKDEDTIFLRGNMVCDCAYPPWI